MSNVIHIAAQVYDQDSHSEADKAFLAAMEAADQEWLNSLNSANIEFGGGSEAWNAVKRLATRQRNAAYARALAARGASESEEEFAQAAE